MTNDECNDASDKNEYRPEGLDTTGHAREELAIVHMKVVTNELMSLVSGMKGSDN